MARSRAKSFNSTRALSQSPKPPVQLSKHDLAQLDAEAFAALSPEQLQRLSLKLLSDLKLAHERLDQSPHNSSRPPSSQAPWERGAGGDGGVDPQASNASPADPQRSDPAPEVDLDQADPEASEPEADEAKPSRASESAAAPRPGQRPGAPGHGRTQRLAIDQVLEHHPTHCSRCGAAFPEQAASCCHQAHHVIDLRPLSPERHALELFQIQHRYHERHCACGHATRAAPGHTPGDAHWQVALSERHLAGARLVALICALALRMRLSRRRIQEFLADWLGLELSIATINQCVHEAARAVEPVVEEQLIAEVRASDLLHADETSWFEHGTLLWLWVFTSAKTTVFTIGKRSKAVLLSILGPVFNGWLMSDGYGAYRELDNRLRCLAHLQRKARGLQQSLDRQGRLFGEAVLTTLGAVMDSVYAAREGPPSTALRQQHAEQLSALWRLCLAQADARHEKTRALARELLNDFETFWVTLDHPELPLTNNEAYAARGISFVMPHPRLCRMAVRKFSG